MPPAYASAAGQEQLQFAGAASVQNAHAEAGRCRIRPKLKPPGTKHLKLECDEVLSTFAFNSNLRPCAEVLSQVVSLNFSLRNENAIMRQRIAFLAQQVAGAPTPPLTTSMTKKVKL
jgi:hypothetical protein